MIIINIMKRVFLLLMTILVAANYADAQDVNPNGYNKFYYPDGSISSEGNLRDGKPDGFWKTYYPNGQLKSIGRRTDFQLDSTWLFFDEAGDTTSLVNYNFDKKNGYSCTYESFNDSLHHNVVKSRELYRDDKRQGFAYYYVKGVLDTEIPFKDDRKHGEGYQYNSEGTVIALLTYKYGQLLDKNLINRIDDKGRKQGIFRGYYPDKKVKWECYYKDDYMNGYYREFDQRGKETKVARYIMGQLQNEDKNSLASNRDAVKVKNEYYPNGGVKSSGGYKDSIPVGVHRLYNEEGKIKGGITYDNEGRKVADGIVDGRGREQGRWTLYDSLGVVNAKGSYKNGKREGPWIFYFDDGKTAQEGSYKDGNPDGTWKWYFPDGKIRRVENFVKGKEDGEYYELSHAGDTLQSGQYYAGDKDGTWRTNTGDALVIEKYSDGTLHGDYMVYYMPDKRLKIAAKYLSGNLHGEYRQYFPDGKLSVDGEYAAGSENGTWRFYSEDGLLESTLDYLQGEVVKVDGNSMPKR